MRILFAIAPGSIAGAERSALASAKALVEDGHFVRFAVLCESRAPRLGDEFVEVASVEGLSCERFEAKGRFDFDVATAMHRFSQNGGFDIVHSHSYKTLAHLCAHRPRQAKLFATFHGATSHTWKVRLYEWLEWSLFHSVDCLFVVSQAALDALGRKGRLRCPTAVVPNPLSFAKPIQAKPRSRQADEPLRLLYAGRLSKEKGVDVLLDALSFLSDRDAVRLEIAGDGLERSALERQTARLGLEGMVRFVGFVSQMQPLMLSADVLVMPSRTEGLPMALIEAAATGLPVVASAVGGIPELVVDGQNGVLVRPEDPRALAQALATFVENWAYLRDNAIAGADEIAARYGGRSWSELAVKHYEKALRSSGLASAASPKKGK